MNLPLTLSSSILGMLFLAAPEVAPVPVAAAAPAAVELAAPIPVTTYTLSGTTTVRNHLFSETEGTPLDISVKNTSSSGNTTMTVKLQQMKSGGSWETLDSDTAKPGETARVAATVHDHFSSTGEQLRLRVSRKILTHWITYTIDW